MSEFSPPVQKNTVFKKNKDSLTAKDKMRLIYVTGQEEDPTAPPDHDQFKSGVTKKTRDKITADHNRAQDRLKRLKPR